MKVIFATFQLFYVNITLKNIRFENHINFNDYTIILIQSNCFLNSSFLNNCSTGFINIQQKSSLMIDFCHFSNNNLKIYKEMSLIMSKTNEDSNILVLINNSNFTNIIGSTNGAV